MAFESKRLRVQLPCKKAGTLIEQERPKLGHTLAAPQTGTAGACHFPTPACHGYRSPVHTLVTCGFPTPGCIGIASPVTCSVHTPACHGYASPPTCRVGYDTPICRGFHTVCNFNSPVCNEFASPFDCGPGNTQMCRGGGTHPGEITETCGATPAERTDIPVERFSDDPETVLINPEHLPVLRNQLEVELEQIAGLEERKAVVEGQLKELDSVEKELKKKTKGK